MLVTMDVVYVNSVSFKHTDSCHELNYSGYKFNFLKLKQLLIDSDIEANLRPMQSGCKSPVRHPKKIKVSKGTAKKCDLTEKKKVNVVSNPKVQNCFFNTI